MPRLAVSVLSAEHWAAAIKPATELPFGRTGWLAMGLAQRPDLRLVPVLVRAEPATELLVPLCLAAADVGQIGCLGYGGIYRLGAGQPTPGFTDIAEALCKHFGLGQLRTLLPPPDVAQGLDRLFAGAVTTPARATYLLAMAGAGAVWTAARGVVRTAVRRATVLGSTASPLADRHAGDLLRLYADTLARHGIACPLERSNVDAILAEVTSGSAMGSIVLDGAGQAQAATLFGFAGNRGYHVMQASSAAGLANNAGHLGMWSALAELADRGVTLVDLGSAANDGQRRFKLAWGATERLTRSVVWDVRRPGEVGQ